MEIQDLLSSLFGANPAAAAPGQMPAADPGVGTDPTAFAPPANPPMPPVNPFRGGTAGGLIPNPDTTPTGTLGSPGATTTGAPSGQVLATLTPRQKGAGAADNAKNAANTKNMMQSLMSALGAKTDPAAGKWQAFSNGFSGGLKAIGEAKAAQLKAEAEALKQHKDDLKSAIDQKLKVNADQRAQLKQAFDQGQTGVVNKRESRKLDIQENKKDTSSDPVLDIQRAENAKKAIYERLGLKDPLLTPDQRAAKEKTYMEQAAKVDAALQGKGGKGGNAATRVIDAEKGGAGAAEEGTWQPAIDKKTGAQIEWNDVTGARRPAGGSAPSAASPSSPDEDTSEE